MKDGYSETEPATVPKARQAGEIGSRWDWVERCVWTERMLTALEKGVKGGKWFSLIDKVSALDNLQRAFAKVKANDGAAGADHQTIEMFEKDLTKNLTVLSQQIKEGSYRPLAGTAGVDRETREPGETALGDTDSSRSDCSDSSTQRDRTDL